MAQKPRNNRWTGWFKKKPSILRPFPSMRLEELEQRDVPATYIWTGAGATPNWSNPANWTPPGGGAPSAPTGATGSPFGYDDLVFPDGPSVRSTVNDILGGTFNSISFSQNGGAGYVVSGNSLILGAAGFPGTGFLNVASAASTNNDIRLDMTLGTSSASSPGNLQTFTVLGGLTISGKLSGHISSNLIKTGPGELTLSGNNIGYQGTINLDSNSGTLVVKNPNALGDTSNGTTVGINSILALDNVGGPIAETLTLNGPGDGEKTLFNRVGNNTLTGPIVLGTADGTDGINFNAAAGTTLTINSTISDTGPDGDILSKEGLGEIVLNAANTYRGLTKVNSGILTIGNAQALGAEGKFENRTIVRSHPFDGQGQLRLADPTGVGFTIFDEWLELNGAGQAGLTNRGSLTNTVGDNTWAGPIFLGSSAPDGVAVTIGTGGGTLTVSGVISTPNGTVNGSPSLTKVDTGTLIFNNANTYACPTFVSEGKLIIRDSQALGANTTTVSNGATLELEVEAGAGPNGSPLANFDAHGRNLSIDSVTGDAHRLQISNVLNLTGLGMLAADGTRIGALYSQSGINVWTNAITSNAAGIGVALDPRPGHPTPDSTYFVNDYSLTTNLDSPQGAIRGSTLTKLQPGHLILPVANGYTGRTFVQSGWITVQNNRSLGARDTSLTQTTQPETFVYDGAAVHLRTLTPTSPPLVIDENFILAGVGPKLPYQFISQKGALMNIGGDNVLGVDSVISPVWSTYVALNGNVGIGVEQIAPLTPGSGEAISRLTMLAWTRDDAVTNSIGLSYPVAGGSVPTKTTLGGITKLGSGLLQLEGEGTYSLDTNIKTGQVSARHNTALGQSTSGTYNSTNASTAEVYNQTNTIVQTGANLLLDSSNPLTSGGINSGIQTTSEQLVLNGTGQQIAVSGFLNPAPTQFFLNVDSVSGLVDTYSQSKRKTAGLQSGLTAQDMQAELNKLDSVKSSEVQTVTTGAVGNFTLTFNGQTTTTPVGGIPAGASAAVVQGALLGLSTIRHHEIQTVTVTGGTAGTDTFLLTFNGQTTAPIPVGATALQVQTALSALTNIGACTVVSGAVPGPGIRYTVTFDGVLVQYTNQPQMTAVGTGLTSVAMGTQQDGFGGTVVVTSAPAAPAGVIYTITFGGDLANQNVTQITGAGSATVTSATLRDGRNGTVTVTEFVVTGDKGNHYTLTFGGDLAGRTVTISDTAADGTLPTITAVASAVQVDVVAAEASYILHYKTQSTGAIPITASAQLVQNELNALTQLTADIGGTAVVTKSGNVYTVLLNSAHSADVPSLTYTSIPTPQGVPEVTINGSTTVDGYVSQASLISLSEDNTWRGPVVMNSGARIAIPQNTRINFLGSIGDATNLNAAGSDLVKRGQGEILLGALNTFRGTAWIDEGYATIANSGALGTVTSGTVVADKAQFQIQGSLTVAGEPLTIQGTGVVDASTLQDKWFNVGAASTNNVATAGNQTTSARITSVTTDPRDPNVIYIATAGGGAWKSKDRGITWNPLFDDTVDTAAVMYGGSIAVAPSDPNTVYFATGEANGGPNGSPITGQQDDYAGTGVYVSNNAGLTWRLLTGPNSNNPVYGLAVSKLLVDPSNAQRIYVATGTATVMNGGVNQVANNAFGTAVPGVYRYDGSAATPNWVNLTGNASANRSTVVGQAPYDTVAPGKAGPDDDYRINFPQSNATWSDIALVVAGQSPTLFGANPGNTITENGRSTVYVLYAALGESQQRYFGGAGSEAIFNAVYRTEDPANAFPAGQGPGWWIGAGTNYPVAEVTGAKTTLAGPTTTIPTPTVPDGRATSTYYDIGPEGDPVAPNPPLNGHQPGRNEWIKLSAVVTRYFNVNPTTGANTLAAGQSINAAIQVYASNLGNSVDNWPYDASGNALPTNLPFGHDNELLDIQRSSWDGGLGAGWTKRLSLDGSGFTSAPFGLATATSNGVGRYSNALSNPSTTFGLLDTTVNADALLYLGGQGDLWRADTTILSAGAGTGVPWSSFTQTTNSPADYFHDMHWYREGGQLRLLTGSDGGLWLSMTPSATVGTFQNLNGNIAAAQINNIDPHPTDINQALAAVYNSGLTKFNGGQAWNAISLPSTGDDRLRDAGDVRYDPTNPQNAWASVGGNLYRTQNGGTTWQLIMNQTDPTRGQQLNSFPIYVDPLNPSRILIGGSTISETRTGSSASPTFTNLGGGNTVAMAPAVYQGQFVADPGFPNVTDHLANSADPDTIYVTDGVTVRVTKNRGLTWIARSPFSNYFPYDITFGGSLANVDIQPISVQSSLSPGGNASANTTTNGSAVSNEVQSLVVVATGGTYRLRVRIPGVGGPPQLTAPLPFNATNQQIQDAINSLNGMILAGGTGSVTVTTGVSNNVITDIAVDPSNRDTVYATVRQRDGSLGKPSVFRTTDAGLTWQDISSNASTASAVSYTNSTPVSVADDNSVASSSVTVTAPAGDAVTNISVTVNIQMGRDRDLSIYLRGPNGLRIPLSLNRPSGFGPGGSNFTNTTFSDSAATPISLGTAPFTGNFKPEVALSGFNGIDPIGLTSGVWTLEVQDNNPNGTTATILNWTLDLTTAPKASGSLPSTQTWTVAVDPRTDTIYVGNDQGVWRLPNASSTTSYNWSRFGDSLPDVQVHDLVVNQTLNTITASTYGRGMYQLFLTDYQPSVGGIRILSGNSIWTGPITLTGDLTITVDGTQEVQNGIAVSSLDILGTITDSTPGNASVLTKKGLGTVMLSAANTYGGQTLVQQGVLRVKNPSALGVADADSNTVVADGAALELASDLRAEPVLLNGDGFLFNGHYTGAMRSIANNNVYTGPVTFGSNVTIGVDRGNDLDTVVNPGVRMDSSLRIGAHPNGTQSFPVATATTTPGGAGVNEVQTITLPNTTGYFNLTFGTATTGLLPRNATAAQVAFALNALTSIGGIGGSVAVTSATVGSGIQYTVTFGGALANTNVQQLVAGESAVAIVGTTQAGSAVQSEVQTVTVLVSTGAFNLTFNGATTGVLPVNATAAQVQAALNGLATIGGVLGSVVVTSTPFGAGTQFTITFGGSLANTDVPQLVAGDVGSINDGGGVRSLNKELGGTLILASPNVIGGQINIISGAIRVEDANALGSTGTFSGTKVTDGAALQLARNAITLAPTVVAGESLSLSGTGQDVTGALRNVRSDIATTGSNDNTWAGPITFTMNPGSNPQTNPGSRIAIRVDDSRIAGQTDTLNIDTNIQQDSTLASFGLIKVGPGRLNLMQANSFTGTTEIGVNLAGRDFQGGSLRIENSNSLGANAVSNSVQVISVDGTTGTYTLSFLGQTTTTLNAATSTAQDVENALNNLSAIGLQPEQQTISPTGSGSYTLTFDGQQTAAIATGAPAATVQAALQGLSSIRRSEIQDVMVSNTAGYFTLTYQGQRTAPLPFNTPASGGVGPAASVQNALNALSTIAPGSVTVVALPAGTVPGATVFRVTFSGNTNRAQIVSQTYTTDTVQDGAIGNPEIQQFALFSTSGTFTISFNGLSTIPLAWNATLQQISDAINALPSISGVNGAVVVTEAAFGSGRRFSLTFTGSLSERNLPEIVADGVGGPATSVVTIQDGLNGSAAVTGSGPYTVTFGGDLANRDVPQIIAGNFTGTAGAQITTSRPGAGVVVSETQSVRGRVFTVTFQRPLDLAVIPQLVATPTSGLAVNVTTAQIGGQGAIVNNTGAPASLEIAGDPTNVGNSINVNRNVVLNGTGVSGSIRVASASVAGGTQYTLTFDGALGNTDIPLATAVGTGGATAAIAGITDGSRASTEVQRVTITGSGGTFTIALNGRSTAALPFNATAAQVQAALAAITSLGGTAGALSNVSGNNTYSGTVTLGTSSHIGATPNSSLSVTSLRDPSPITVAAPSLTKVGQGTISFTNANSYGGQTTVRDGVLNIRNPQGVGTSRNEVQIVSTLSATSPGGFALTFNGQQTVPLVFGAPASGGTLVRDSVQNALNALTSVRRSEVQTVTLSGSATGSFTLTFNGQSTSTLSRVGLTAAQVQTALEALPSIGVGNVLVTLNGSVFTISFQASLANKDLAPIVAIGQGGTIATAGVVTDGLGGIATVTSDVIPGGIQYTITFSGDLAGTNLPDVLVTSGMVFTGTQTAGGAGVNEVQTVESLITGGQTFRLAFNGQTSGTISAPADATQIKNALEALSSVKRNEVQDVIVTGTSGTFTIQVTTPDNVTTVTQPIAFNATAATVQTELTSLTNVGAGNVTVAIVPSSAGTTTYRVTFQGTLGNRNIQAMVATRVGTSQITTQVVTNTEGLNGSVSVIAANPSVPNLFSVTFTGDLANTDVPQITGTSATTPGFITARTSADGNGAETQYLQVVGSNGTFSLSFRGQTTGTLQFFATAADVENALNALSTIGGTTGGFVTVTKSGLSTSPGGAVYTIHFGGTLGVTNLPAITTNPAGGITTAAITTGNDGPEGTRVLDGATLQLQGTMTMDREVVTLNGQGFMNQGALNQVGGTTTWQALAANVQIPLFLESNSSIGTTQATDRIVFQLPITDAGTVKNLDIYGPGTIVYTGSPTASFNGITYTQYTGTTTVHDGTLLLSRVGFASVLGALVVGDGTGAANTAVVRETTNNQVADTSTLLVNSDGLFDLNTFQDTVSDVTVVGGHIDTGIGGQLTTGFIDMTGGLIDIRDAATVTASKNITMRGATVQGGIQSTLIGVDLAMSAFGSPTPVPSVLDFGNKGVVSVRDVTMSGGSTIDFDNDGSMVARNITATGGHIAFLDKGSLIASGDVSGMGTNFTFGQLGLMNVSGNLTETNGTISFGASGTLTVLGTAVLNNANAQFGNQGTATIGGTLSATNNSKIDFGDTGTLNVIGSATLTDSDLTMGDGADASTANLTATRADLSFGAAVTGGSSSLTSKAVTATDSTFTFGDSGNWTADSITATNTSVDFGQSGRVAVVGNVDLSNSTIHFDDAGRLDALDVSGVLNTLIEFLLNGILNVDDFVLKSNSKLSMGKASATASTMDLTDSFATFGAGSKVTVSSTVNLQDSTLTVGSTAADPSLVMTGNVTMDPSYIVLGDSAVALLGDMTTTGGSVTGADNVQVNAGTINSDGTDFIFGNNATMNADTVSVKNANVTFGTDGTFNTTGNLSLDGSTVTLGDRNLQDPIFATQSINMQNASVISLGANTQGSSGGITMAGSTFSLGAGAVHTLGGDVIASSTATDKSQILGPGTLSMGGADRNFAITGPRDVDLLVTSLIDSSPTERLVKTGDGRLEFAPAGSGFSGPVSIFAGDVQVDTHIGSVNLKNAAASLSGTGTVGQIDGAPPTGTRAVGTVAPGVNWSANPYGTLNSGAVLWGPSTTFSVNIQHISAGAPVPGVDNDLLASSGAVSINGAKLAGFYDGTGVQLNDQFTIITAAGGVSGKFAQTNGQDIVFIDGHKFTITYNANSVVLNKVQSSIVSMNVVSSVNPATQRQPIVLTATMVPESGSGFIPATNTVKFTFTNTLTLQQFTGTVNVTAGTNQATFNTNLNLDPSPSLLPDGKLPGGSYTVTADYSGDPVDFLPKSATLTGQPLVIEIPVFDTLTVSTPVISPANPSSVGVKDSTSISVNVTNERGQLQSWSLTIQDLNNPSRTLVISNPTSPFGPAGAHTIVPISAVWDGRIGGTIVSGDYSVTATFVDMFGNTGSSNVATVTVDDTSPTITSFTNDSPNGLLSPNLSGLATPQVLTLTGTVGDPAFPGHPAGTFQSWTIEIKPFGSNTVVRSITGTNTNVNAAWDGKNNGGTFVPDGVYTITIRTLDAAGNNTTSTGQTIVVLNSPPTVSASSNSPTLYGNSITITAVVNILATDVNVPNSIRNLLIGDNVEFYLNGSTLLGSAPISFNGTQYVATYTTTATQVIHAGVYNTAFARYTGSPDFAAGNSPTFTHTVNKRDLHIAGKNPVNKVYGDAVPALDLASGNVLVTTADLQYSDTAASVLAGSAATTATNLSHVIPAGYPITQGTIANTTGDYNILWTNGKLVVTKKDITLTIDDKERPYHGANPAFTFTGAPMANGDVAMTVVSGLTLTTTATPTSLVGSYPIFATGTATAQDYNIVNIVNGTLKVVPIPTPLAVGAGQGGAPLVKIYSTNGTPAGQTYAFSPSFTGGVRVASGDFNRDGVMDYAYGTGPGGRAQVRVINGATRQEMFNVFPFENFTGGVYVAAGDIDGDGAAELVITPDEGGGPRVVAYSGLTFQPFISYFGIQDPNFRGGARAAVGDLNGDGYADIAVSAGFNGGPRISLWDGKAITNHQFKNMTSDFFAYDQSLRNGAYVAIGDVNGDGKGDLITGAGPGGAPHVKIFNGADLLNPAIGPGHAGLIASFFAGNPNNRGGIRVAVKSFDADLNADLVTGVGEKGGSSFATYLGKDLTAGVVDEYFGDDAFPGFSNGVYVG